MPSEIIKRRYTWDMLFLRRAYFLEIKYDLEASTELV